MGCVESGRGLVQNVDGCTSDSGIVGLSAHRVGEEGGVARERDGDLLAERCVVVVREGAPAGCGFSPVGGEGLSVVREALGFDLDVAVQELDLFEQMLLDSVG